MEERISIEQLSDEVDRLARVGNDALDSGDWRRAVDVWTQAYRMLPEPRDVWPQVEWLCGSIADALWVGKQYDGVVGAATEALASSGPPGNPFVLMRLGQGLYERGDVDEAHLPLYRAWQLAGDDVFEQEDPKYLELVRSRPSPDR